MASLDDAYSPFYDYPGYSSMAPCMRSCNDDFGYNGCDNARCWCNKGNLDLRIATITRCASTGCTYANMNTETDVSVLSGIQVQYCADRGFSPEGMTMPSTADASPTGSGSPFETGTAALTATDSRGRPSSGPAATGSASSSSSSDIGSSVLSTAARAGIGIGAAFCVLVLILIALMLVRRRKRQPQYFPPPQPQFQNGPPAPPPMAPTPYSGNGPFSPPPLQQPAPIHIPQNKASFAGNGGDVSPIEEKAPGAMTINRKEIKSGTKTPVSSPSPPAAPPVLPYNDNGPREVYGSVPPPRHEISNAGQITNTVSTRGMELDSTQPPPVNQYPGQGQPQYQESRQGPWSYNYPGQAQAHEIDGGQNQWQPRQELPSQGQPPQGGYGRTYELGPSR